MTEYEMPRLIGAIVVTDMRLCHQLHTEYGWVILHDEMREANDPDDIHATHHQFVVLGIPEDQAEKSAKQMQNYTFINTVGSYGNAP